MKTRVVVVAGGANSEHDVSMATANGVQAALTSTGHVVVRLDLDRSGRWLQSDGTPISPTEAVRRIGLCDVLFPLVHGPDGEDGTLAGFARLLGIPSVGTGVRGGALAMDKWATKLVAAELGVRVADARLVRLGDQATWEGPCVVKPVAAGSSRGVSLVESPADLDAALGRAFAEDDRVLVEEVVVGREIDVAVLRRRDGSLLLGTLEIGVDGFFDYDAKYSGGARFQVPARLTAAEEADLHAQAVTLFTALDCAGVARVDFFLTESGWVLNEINTVPGMTPTSQVPLVFESLGLSYEQLVTELVAATVLDVAAA